MGIFAQYPLSLQAGQSTILQPDLAEAASLEIACVCVQETLKSVIAQYNASQLLTMREVSVSSLLTLAHQCAFFASA